ncbi:MAG: hypothetical protein ACRED4_00835 [Brevundimonas sp.]
MKSVKFAKRHRHQLTDTSYQEWPAGAEDIVSDAVAKKAEAAGVLDGEPVDVAEGAAAPKARTRSKAKA